MQVFPLSGHSNVRVRFNVCPFCLISPANILPKRRTSMNFRRTRFIRTVNVATFFRIWRNFASPIPLHENLSYAVKTLQQESFVTRILSVRNSQRIEPPLGGKSLMTIIRSLYFYYKSYRWKETFQVY